MEPRALSQSWTNILAGMTFVSALLAFIATQITQVIPAETSATVIPIIMMVVGVLNFAIRYWRTDAPIAGSPRDPSSKG